jgi:hypothetical protein
VSWPVQGRPQTACCPIRRKGVDQRAKPGDDIVESDHFRACLRRSGAVNLAPCNPQTSSSSCPTSTAAACSVAMDTR